MRYLLDSDVVSEPLRPKPAGGVMRNLRTHGADAAIAAPVWHELRFGCARLPPSQRRAAIERYLQDVVLASFPVLEYDREAADWQAVERARLVDAGRTPAFVDGQIAAIAFVNDLVLVTSNVRDFKGFQELRIENWA